MKKRNILKKTLAVVLAFAMMTPIAGNLEANVKKVKAASTEDSLNIKCQVTQGVVKTTNVSKYQDKYVMRFVSAVNNYQDYKEIGFKLVEEGVKGEKKAVVTTVFKRIESTTGSTEDGTKETYNYSPKVINTDGEYFITAKLPIEEGKEDTKYTVWAYGIKTDGSSVTGAARCISVKDGLEKNGTGKINMSFQNTSSIVVNEGDTLKANDLDATVIGVTDDTVHVRITKPTSALPSATLFEFKTQDGQTTVGKEVFRNLNTKYTGSASADKTWYTAYMDATEDQETEFIIATVADFRGFEDLVNDTTAPVYFENKTVYLVSDMIVNDEILNTDRNDTTNYKKWKKEDGTYEPTPSYTWDTIGSYKDGARAFAGTFDGQMHTISGIYISKASSEGCGLFRATRAASKVKNFRLENSYFNNGNERTGSIVGTARGTIHNVYSNAIVVSNKSYLGGIAGISAQVNMSNCWFDGIVQSKSPSGGYPGKGGILGCVASAQARLENCLNTGIIDLTEDYATVGSKQYAKAGGIVGYCHETTNGVPGVLTVISSVNVGKILINDDDTQGVGRILGWRTGSCTYYGYNTYATEESLVKPDGTVIQENYSNNQVGQTDTSLRPTVVSENAIKGAAAQEVLLPQTGDYSFDFNYIWRCGEEGKFPFINFHADIDKVAIP